MRHQSDYETAKYDTFANRALCREWVVVTAGDEPTAALTVTNPEASNQPYRHKLGDLQGAILLDGNEIPFTQADIIETEFAPGSTIYKLQFDCPDRVILSMEVSLLKDDGMVVTVGVVQASHPLSVHLAFGGFQHCDRAQINDGSWYKQDVRVVHSVIEKNDTSEHCVSGISYVNDELFDYDGRPPIQEKCFISFVADDMLISEVVDDHLHVNLTMSVGAYMALTAVYEREDHTPANRFVKSVSEAQELIRTEKRRRENLLENCKTQIPSAILQGGFLQNVLNLDSVRAGKAWLELRQWWNTYITNNYQISAAIALGYYDLAKEALLFFGLQPGGYVLLDANGKTVPPYANAYDGLLYYIPQLYQYTMQTGDMSVVEMVADNVIFMFDGMERFRVQSPSGLFSYRLGCNMFMYQADHLGMPGESASASMMMACDYQLFAVLCRKIGRNDLAEQYEKRAQSIWDILPERLWNKERQCFYNHVDLQGKPHNAHYYTDLVFPQLYTSLDRTYKLNSLAYLKESLLFPSHTTKMPLIRVGDFKPTIFANDNVMPTQMAEAARAFMQSGDTMLAAALMESVAFASTIYTDSPGSMPERMNDEGRGEPNFQLGNAIGSFLYTYIAGLFGIRVDNFGNELHIEPALPDDWDHACLELPYCRLEFSRVNRDEIVLKIKQAENYPALVIGVVVPPCSHAEMYVNGKEYPVCLSPLLGHTRVCAEITGLAEEINVVIHIHEQEIEQPELISGLEGFPIVSDYDIIEDNAVTNGNVVPGEYCLYARSKAACALIEIPVIIKPRNEIMVLEVLDLPSGHCRITMMAEFPLQKEMIC